MWNCSLHRRKQVAPILFDGLSKLEYIGISVEKGCDVDKPRNLAKSVTVE